MARSSWTVFVVSWLLILEGWLSTSVITHDNPHSYNIGGVLSNNESIAYFEVTITVNTTLNRSMYYYLEDSFES